MSVGLKEYQAKRDFSKTPEPQGKVAPARGALSFVVQKHDATRLHYDFRLEWEGVLKSWAIPKGPSLNPEDKRLAVEVEDHPLDYGEFEGVIPEGEYGGGTVLLWDRGTWVPELDPEEGFKKGHLKFTLEGGKLRGSWALVRTSLGDEEKRQWLLIKHRDGAASSADILKARPESVATGRTIEQIALDRDRVWNSKPVEEKSSSGRSRRKRHSASAEQATIPYDELDQLGARKGALPAPFTPQLATLAKEPPAQGPWIYEIKYDGYRILCFLKDGKASLISRNGLDWTARLGVIARAVEALPARQALLDGEAVALQPDGKTSFQALQNLMEKGRATDLRFFAFDLLHLDGYDLRGMPLRRRKALLARVIGGGTGGTPEKPIIMYSDHFEGDGRAFYETACRHGLEGIVAKRGDRPYRTGRGGEWIKVKCSRRAEFVIGGYTEPGGSRTEFGALLVGYYEDGKLRFAGKVGTGYTRDTLRAVMKKMAPLEQEKSPFADAPRGLGKVHWLRPELVGEVAFGEWTDENILRHPSFQGLREDKPAAEVRRDAPAMTPQEAPPSAAKLNGPSSNIVHHPSSRTSGRAGKNVEIAGIQISNPERVLYPEQGITKLDLARYYEKVSDRILPYITDRLLTLVRCPSGRHQQCFYQRHVNETTPPELLGLPVTRKGETENYMYIEGQKGLIALIQMGVLELHVWGSNRRKLDQPDQMIFDLDPGPGVAWTRVTAAARRLREMLGELDLEAFIKTTGGKGLHVVVPLVPAADWPQVKDFTHRLADRLADEDPAGFTKKITKSKREGKIYVDYLRNDFTSTAIAPFSTRAREGAPVAAPLRWDELTDNLADVARDIRTMPQRLARQKRDPWADYFKVKQKLTATRLRSLK